MGGLVGKSFDIKILRPLGINFKKNFSIYLYVMSHHMNLSLVTYHLTNLYKTSDYSVQDKLIRLLMTKALMYVFIPNTAITSIVEIPTSRVATNGSFTEFRPTRSADILQRVKEHSIF